MIFGEVIEILRSGRKRASRKGWHGRGMWIYVEQGKTIPHNQLREPQKTWLTQMEGRLGFDMTIAPHFNLFVDGIVVTGWVASQTDMLATDWYILEDNQPLS